jgi:hypothetical protein
MTGSGKNGAVRLEGARFGRVICVWKKFVFMGRFIGGTGDIRAPQDRWRMMKKRAEHAVSNG